MYVEGHLLCRRFAEVDMTFVAGRRRLHFQDLGPAVQGTTRSVGFYAGELA